MRLSPDGEVVLSILTFSGVYLYPNQAPNIPVLPPTADHPIPISFKNTFSHIPSHIHLLLGRLTASASNYLLFLTVSAASGVQGTIVFSWTIAVTGPLRQSVLRILAVADVQIG